MFTNYVLIAGRHILKNKLYSSINILGLVVGLTVFLFGSLLSNYEKTHDDFFKNTSRIFFVGSVFSPTADISISSLDSVHTALGPLIKSDIPEIDFVARTLRKEKLISIDADDFYQTMLFSDADLLRIFDFNFIEGSDSALDAKNGLVLTRSAVIKYFGEGSAVGRSIELDHDKVLNVTAVIEDLPKNTQFSSSLLISSPFEMIAHISALNTEDNNVEEGNWNNLNLGDLTYVLAPPEIDKSWLQTRLDGIYTSHIPPMAVR